MSERTNWFILLVACGSALSIGAAEAVKASNSKVICVGRVEAVDGEVELSAQMSGTLRAVLVKEGDRVTNGMILAEVDARREKAALDLAVAKLARVRAGNGKEEIAAAYANREALAAELAFAESEYQRATRLHKERVFADDELDKRRQQAATLQKQVASAEKQAGALKRGPLPEDIALAEAEVGAARTAYEMRLVRAVSAGSVLQLYPHAGDFVSLSFPTPVLRMANTHRVRLEVNEQDVYRLKEGLEGEFTTFGAGKPGGRVVVKTILASFAPRRLFEPDSTARMDTRTLQVLGEVVGDVRVYSGQRLTVTFICQ
jgi:multidrug resistance efflux pump